MATLDCFFSLFFGDILAFLFTGTFSLCLLRMAMADKGQGRKGLHLQVELKVLLVYTRGLHFQVKNWLVIKKVGAGRVERKGKEGVLWDGI